MVAFGRGNSRRPANHKAGQLAATERLSRQAVWGAAMDLGEWLKGLGLGQYEETFHEHEIDADVLPDLTEADLEKIGLPLGAQVSAHRGVPRAARGNSSYLGRMERFAAPAEYAAASGCRMGPTAVWPGCSR